MVTTRRAAEEVIKPWKLPKHTNYLLHNANVIDPVNGRTFSEIDVKLKDGIIESVMPTKHSSSLYDVTELPKEERREAWLSPAWLSMVRENWLSLQRQEGYTIIDCTGKFLCPGLIDCHVHLMTVPGEATLDALNNIPTDVSLLRQPWVANQMLERGFTTVRDCGGASLALKEAIAEGVIPGPRLFISGHGISQTGGHGDARKAHDAGSVTCGGHIKGLGRVADGVAECQKAVRDELRSGADFIKIMCSGGVASPTDKLDSTQYTAKEIRTMTEIAENMGTYVTAHAYTPKAIQQAIRNGVRGIEHGNLIDKETAELMAAKECFLTPTLVTYATMASEEFEGFLTPDNVLKNKEVLKVGLNSLKIAHEAGVTMCFGSDLLGPMGYTQSREFGLRGQVLEAKTVLQAATVNAAQLLRQEEFLGQIKPGFAADLLILNSNPLKDISILEKADQHFLAVIKDGRVWSSRWSKLELDVRPASRLLE